MYTYTTCTIIRHSKFCESGHIMLLQCFSAYDELSSEMRLKVRQIHTLEFLCMKEISGCQECVILEACFLLFFFKSALWHHVGQTLIVLSYSPSSAYSQEQVLQSSFQSFMLVYSSSRSIVHVGFGFCVFRDFLFILWSFVSFSFVPCVFFC